MGPFESTAQLKTYQTHFLFLGVGILCLVFGRNISPYNDKNARPCHSSPMLIPAQGMAGELPVASWIMHNNRGYKIHHRSATESERDSNYLVPVCLFFCPLSKHVDVSTKHQF